MLPDRVSNPGPLTYESGALPIAVCSPARWGVKKEMVELLLLKVYWPLTASPESVLAADLKYILM